MQITIKIEDHKLAELLNFLKTIDFVEEIPILKEKQLINLENQLNLSQKQTWEGVKQGMKDVKNGKTRKATDFLRELDN